MPTENVTCLHAKRQSQHTLYLVLLKEGLRVGYMQDTHLHVPLVGSK